MASPRPSADELRSHRTRQSGSAPEIRVASGKAYVAPLGATDRGAGRRTTVGGHLDVGRRDLGAPSSVRQASRRSSSSGSSAWIQCGDLQVATVGSTSVTARDSAAIGQPSIGNDGGSGA